MGGDGGAANKAFFLTWSGASWVQFGVLSWVPCRHDVHLFGAVTGVFFYRGEGSGESPGIEACFVAWRGGVLG